MAAAQAFRQPRSVFVRRIFGDQHHLDRDFNSLGPSLAMLPSAREAAVMYAELESFVRYYVDVRHQSLADLIAALPASKSPAEAVEKATKTAFATWVQEWKQWVKATHSNPPLATSIGLGLAKPPIQIDGGTYRVAQLLVAFGFYSAASKRFDTLPTPAGDPTAASWYSQAYAHSGFVDKALALLTDTFAGPVAFWFQTRAQTYEMRAIARIRSSRRSTRPWALTRSPMPHVSGCNDSPMGAQKRVREGTL